MQEDIFRALILFILGSMVLMIGANMLHKAKMTVESSKYVPASFPEVEQMRQLKMLCGEFGWGHYILKEKLASGSIKCGDECKSVFVKKYSKIPILMKQLQLDKSVLCKNCVMTRECISSASVSDENPENKLKSAAESCAYVCDWIMRREEVCGNALSEIWITEDGGFASPCLIRDEPLP